MPIKSTASGGGGGGATTLDALTDVTITAVADKNLLRYDSLSSQWINISSASDFLSQYLLLSGRTGGQAIIAGAVADERLGLGIAPAARLHIAAGSTAAGTAPIKLTSGALTTTATVGQIEFLSPDLYFTISGATRKRIVIADPSGGLTSGRVPFVTTSGRLTDISGFLYDSITNTLTVTNVDSSNLTASGNIQGAFVTATNNLEAASRLVVNSNGLLVSDITNVVTYPLDIEMSDVAIGAFISVNNVSATNDICAGQFVLSDANTGVQSGQKIGLLASINALTNAAATSSISLVAGLKFTNFSQINSTLTVGESAGIWVANTIAIGGGASTISKTYGIDALVDVIVYAGSTSGTEIIGANLQVGATGIPVSKLAGVCIKGSTFGPIIAGATAAVAYDIDSSFGAHSGVTTWYGLRIPSISGPGTIWGIYQSGTMDSAIAGNLRIGSTTAPTVALDITGSVKVSTLTSGRVVFSGSGGLLSDDADFTFSVDTLTVTKIAATTFTGNLTIADAINIILNATTGTKIGTATTQKLGFWNATPIVQPTNAVAAATFVANTSGIVDDSATFDGYTLGQVVKALRNIGLLA